MNRIEPVKPVAKFRKPWRTKRNSTIAGVLIVALSVVTINVAIKTLSGGRDYLVATEAVAAGTPLREVATTTISLSLGEASGEYLQPGFAQADLVLSQPLQAGQLILKRDLEQSNPADDLVRLAISAKTVLPNQLEAGDKIDIWAAAGDGSGQFGQPELIARSVEVASKASNASLFGESANRLEIQVPSRELQPILAAVLHNDAMSVVARSGVK